MSSVENRVNHERTSGGHAGRRPQASTSAPIGLGMILASSWTTTGGPTRQNAALSTIHSTYYPH